MKDKNTTQQKSQDGIREFLTSATLPCLLLDSELNLVEINKAALRLFQKGTKKKDLLNKNLAELVPDLKESGRFDKYLEVIRTGKPISVEDTIIHPKFGDRHLNINAFKVGDRLGLVLIDITESKQAEKILQQALEDSRRRQKEITALLNGTQTVLESRLFEDTACSIFYSCQKLIGATAGYVALLSSAGTLNEVLFLEAGGLPCTVDPDLPMPIRGLRAEAYRSGKVVYDNDFSHSQWMKFMPQGHVKLQNVLFAPLVIEEKAVGLMGLANKQAGFTDNDAHLAAAFARLAAVALTNSRTLELLEDSEERYHSVVQTATDAIITINSRGKIAFVNAAAEILFGYSTEEIVGQAVTKLMPERYHQAHMQGLLRIEKTGKQKIIGKTVEVFGLRKDGQEFPLELSLAKWGTKEDVFFTAILRDITEKKHLIQQLIRSERFAASGQLAVYVAHEINSPLQGVIALLRVMEKENKENLKLFENISLVKGAFGRIEYTVKNLLNLNRPGIDVKQPVNVNNIIESSVLLVRTYLKQNRIKISLKLSPKVTNTMAASQQLSQVLMNLINNAVEAINNLSRPKKGGKEQAGKDGEITIASQQKRDEIIIKVSDNGPGITKESLEYVFDPFYTKKKAVGMGIGLSICHSIIEEHQGSISIKNAPQGGAVITITLKKC